MHDGKGYPENNQDYEILGDAIQGSVVRIDLLAFFQANPHTVDTAAGLARRLHRALEEIQLALNPLVRIGIIQESKYNRVSLYKLKNGELMASFFNTQRGDTVLE
ncbi:MAG TPA: hypothetical protein GXX59_00450 [Syntrophomonadaceae bacterium]|nr:hypothetical protein [Syntrophomonadaceae bacterium]